MNDSAPPTQSTASPLFVCPFCGSPTPDQARCAGCHGPLDPLSRQATQNAMGPWFIRDEQQPFRPGCSYETMLSLIARGKVTGDTILRGPSTSQFWYPARRVPGIANHLGVCHSCQGPAVGTLEACPKCGAAFHTEPERQFLGLMPLRMVPGGPLVRTEDSADEALPAPRSVGPVPRRSGIDSRLEQEIASLRQRVGLLIGLAAVCALVALVAVGLTASGLWAPAPPIGSAPISTAPEKLPAIPSSKPAESNSAAKKEPQTAWAIEERPAEPAASQPAKEPSTQEPAKTPEAGPELSLVRSTRWP